MKSQSLLDKGRVGGRARANRSVGWNVYTPEKQCRTETADDADEREAKWQKHVVVLLWVCLALVITIGSALIYAHDHGLIRFGPVHQTPLPVEWPVAP